MEARQLTLENIGFIDNYLKNSGIGYVDVRMELVDHIGISLESAMHKSGQPFYDVFKNYMAVHKKELLTENKKLIKRLRLSSIHQLLPILGKWPFVFGFLMFFVVLTFFEDLFGRVFPYNTFLWGLLFITLGIYFLTTLPKKRFRFSMLEALAWPLVALSYLMHIFFNLTDTQPMAHGTLPFFF